MDDRPIFSRNLPILDVAFLHTIGIGKGIGIGIGIGIGVVQRKPIIILIITKRTHLIPVVITDTG